MKKRWQLLTMMACMVVVTACGGNNDNENGDAQAEGEETASDETTLIIGATGDPQTFNPDARADDYFYPMAQNIFSRLVKINNEQEIIPDLAKEWEFNDEGTEITFYLHENVEWHDGEPFTAEDVKFTLDAIVEYSGHAVGNLDSMEDVEIVDDNTVVVTLSEPDASFLGYLAWYATFIVPEHIYDGENWDAGTSIEPVGTGPFKFSDYTTGVNVTLEKNENYFGETPKMEQVIFSIIPDLDTMVQSFYNGELDILGTTPPSSEIQNMIDSDEYVAEPLLWPSREYLVFNFDEEPFDQLEVRQAVAYALDNEDIVSRALRGQSQVAEHFLSPAYEWVLSDEYTVPGQNQERARELLEEAGYSEDSDGYYFSIDFNMFEAGSYVDMATVIQEQLRQVGIDVHLNVMEYASWQEQVTEDRNFQLSMLGGYQGPDVGAVASRISSEGTTSFSGHINDELDQLLEEGVRLVTEEERAPVYEDVQRILLEDLPIYPISEWVGFDPHHDYVKGAPTSEEAIPYTGFSEYTYVTIEK